MHPEARLRSPDYLQVMAVSDEGPARDPDVVIVMGVSGSGKTTVAKGISTVMGWEFAEGDAFHSDANVAKMRERPRRSPTRTAGRG